MSLQLNDIAPDFSAYTTEGWIKFYDWADRAWVMLFSHPQDFTPVCTTELGCAAKLKPEFDTRNVKIIGLSVDSIESHLQWADDILETQGHALNFPIIADTNRAVAKLYGMLHPRQDALCTVRAVFVVDPQRRVRLTMTYPHTTGRNFDEILRVIDALQLADNYCVTTPANWRQGDEVMIAPSLSDELAKRKFPVGWRAAKSYLRIAQDPYALPQGMNEARI